MESQKKYPPTDSRTEQMIKEYAAGEALRAWEYMGSHQEEREGIPGYVFRVWAPHAAKVSVVGDFNGWEADIPISPALILALPSVVASTPQTIGNFL